MSNEDNIIINEGKNIILTDKGEEEKEEYDDDNADLKTCCISKVNSDEKKEIELDAAPSFISSINLEKKSNICDCIEIDKLLLKHCYFYYKSNIKDYYKVTFRKECEMSYNRIKQNAKKYDTFINNFHYNFTNLNEYTKEVKDQLNKRNTKKINFILILRFKNENIDNIFNNKQEKDIYKFNISTKYKFLYSDNKGNIIYKKKYEHKNILDDKTRLTKINMILTEIENILNEIYENEKNNIKIKEVVPEIIIMPKKRKINLINNNKLNIISFQKELHRHNNCVQMIKEFPCGKFVSCGFDGNLVLYNENFDKIYDENIIDNWIYSISEIPNTQNEFMVCCPEKIFLVSITDNNLEVKNKRLNLKNSIFKYSFTTKDNEIILCSNNSLTQYEGILKEKENNDIFVINKLHSTSGKKITNNIISVVSNKVLNKGNKGEDILKIINTNNRNEIHQEEYSFNTNPNSLLLINTNVELNNNLNEGYKKKKKNKKNKNIQKSNNKEKAKLLLCACTKYYNDQKNGILVFCPNGKTIKDNFYDTKDFEVFCFCSLKNSIDNGLVDINYLLVGGYDNNLNQGLIKLYEIIYDETIESTKLNFIRNIRNLSFIKEPINCIIQSSKTGEIIATSWDGSVNLFTKPNLEFLN